MKKLNKNSILLLLAVFFVIAAVTLVKPRLVQAATSPTLTGAASYSVLGASTVTNTVTATTTSGDVGVSTGTAITNFPPGIAGGDNSIHLHSNDASAIAAQADNLAAFGALDQGCDFSFGAQDLTLLSPLGPGVYCSSSSFSLSGNLTLTGSGVWIFKSVSTLITATDSSVTGGDPCNVWWRVGSSATLGVRTSFIGNILALASVTLNTDATLNGRAMAQTAAVTLDHNTITGPTCATPAPATINVVKVVTNDSGGTKNLADFPLFVNGTPVVSGVTNTFAPGSYTITETTDPLYTAAFSIDCDSSGHLTLIAGNNKVCIITNNDIVIPSSGNGLALPVPPLIDVVKVPSPLALPAGPGSVTYTYTLRNTGTVPVSNITMVGDTCSPIVLISGDINNDAKLDVNETWTYTCTTILSATHTNTVVATGMANGITATDIASATVVVGVPLVPPLIHVTKIPNPLTLSAAGGIVTYTETISNPGTVALSQVTLIDDKCGPVNYISGDTNSDSKLDPVEAWIYTCQANLAQTTTNTAIASGMANGLTVRDFAIATVVVAVPGFPNAGLPPLVNSIPWNMVMLSGMLLLCSILLLIFSLRIRTS